MRTNCHLPTGRFGGSRKDRNLMENEAPGYIRNVLNASICLADMYMISPLNVININNHFEVVDVKFPRAVDTGRQGLVVKLHATEGMLFRVVPYRVVLVLS